jgi:hypothetical protein
MWESWAEIGMSDGVAMGGPAQAPKSLPLLPFHASSLQHSSEAGTQRHTEHGENRGNKNYIAYASVQQISVHGGQPEYARQSKDHSDVDDACAGHDAGHQRRVRCAHRQVKAWPDGHEEEAQKQPRKRSHCSFDALSMLGFREQGHGNNVVEKGKPRRMQIN